jgi:hypothetical protein
LEGFSTGFRAGFSFALLSFWIQSIYTLLLCTVLLYSVLIFTVLPCLPCLPSGKMAFAIGEEMVYNSSAKPWKGEPT